MKNAQFILLALALLVSLHTQGQALVSTKVKDVTVFLDRAQLTHTETVSLKAGEQTVTFRGLSPKFLKETVQVSGKGTSGFTILSVKPQVNYLEERMASKKFQELSDSLQYYKDKAQENKDEQEILKQDIDMLIKNQQIPESNNTLTPTQVAAMADFMKERMLKNKARLRTLERAYEAYQTAQRRIQNQMRSISQQIKTSVGEVVVELTAKMAQKADFTLSYLVSQAGWVAQYDLRAEAIGKPIDLAYKAAVKQTTGIDWENINLQISTSNPTLGATKPDNPTRYLQVYQPVAIQQKMAPQAVYRSRQDKMFSKEEEEDMTADWGAEMPVAESAADFTEATETPFATTFKISLPYTIPSDGRPVIVEVSQEEVPAAFTYATVPASEEAAFLIAYLSDWQNLGLTNGPANIYFEGNYVGETQINPAITTDSLTLSMGRDTRLSVLRKPIKDFNKRNMIGRNVRETKGFEIQLRNNRSEAVTLEVEDYIPISQDSRIEVEVGELSQGSFNPVTGKVLWRMTLKGGESKTLKIAYTIKYPKGILVRERLEGF
ncbi:MAG: DUF4139 domain-containing protein [Bernardetiaceae bacterium]